MTTTINAAAHAPVQTPNNKHQITQNEAAQNNLGANNMDSLYHSVQSPYSLKSLTTAPVLSANINDLQPSQDNKQQEEIDNGIKKFIEVIGETIKKLIVEGLGYLLSKILGAFKRKTK